MKHPSYRLRESSIIRRHFPLGAFVHIFAGQSAKFNISRPKAVTSESQYLSQHREEFPTRDVFGRCMATDTQPGVPSWRDGVLLQRSRDGMAQSRQAGRLPELLIQLPAELLPSDHTDFSRRRAHRAAARCRHCGGVCGRQPSRQGRIERREASNDYSRNGRPGGRLTVGLTDLPAGRQPDRRPA